MNEEQKKAFTQFAKIAKRKNFHSIVCLSAAAIMDQSGDNWKETMDAIIQLAEKSKNGDEFLKRLLNDFKQYVQEVSKQG